MSMRRKMRRRGGRFGRGGHSHRLDLRTRLALALVALGVGVILVLSLYAGYGPGSHPDPRRDVTAAGVVPAERFAEEHIRSGYAAAAEVPHVLDGLFCYCRCRRHMGHRSLLRCFESAHGAECPVCLRSAVVAHRVHGEGADLEMIRQAIDDLFGPRAPGRT